VPPNLASESLLLYSFNKTSDWLNGLSETDRDTIMKGSMDQRRVLYEKFAVRRKEIKEIKKKKIRSKRTTPQRKRETCTKSKGEAHV
jgi:hypothetical protein